MKQKSKYQQELEKEPFYNLKEEEFGEEVKFKIDKDSFKGPFKCHGKKTGLIDKRISYGDIEFKYNVWQCKACKKEYLDFEQARKYEKFLIMKKALEDKLVTVERSMNFDGKTYFFRFPKELASNLHREDLVDIKLLSTDGRMFLVEVKHRH
ncbi:hypothetical protein HYU50_00290 [Candidatus Woesearchaeota archaeon]|nr:hypothetical protein [Candidatus Woesearchaeota archaeon]